MPTIRAVPVLVSVFMALAACGGDEDPAPAAQPLPASDDAEAAEPVDTPPGNVPLEPLVDDLPPAPTTPDGRIDYTTNPYDPSTAEDAVCYALYETFIPFGAALSADLDAGDSSAEGNAIAVWTDSSRSLPDATARALDALEAQSVTNRTDAVGDYGRWLTTKLEALHATASELEAPEAPGFETLSALYARHFPPGEASPHPAPDCRSL